MKKFKEFDVVTRKEQSDQVADLLKDAGIRITQRVKTKTGTPPLHVIAVHPDDIGRAEEVRSAARRRESEDFARTLAFVRRPYSDKDMLIAREPNEAGYYCSGIYHDEPFDETKFRLIRGGWDHEHCYLCWAKVVPGDEWWATQPPNYEDEIGLCLDCHDRLFGSDSAEQGAAEGRDGH